MFSFHSISPGAPLGTTLTWRRNVVPTWIVIYHRMMLRELQRITMHATFGVDLLSKWTFPFPVHCMGVIHRRSRVLSMCDDFSIRKLRVWSLSQKLPKLEFQIETFELKSLWFIDKVFNGLFAIFFLQFTDNTIVFILFFSFCFFFSSPSVCAAYLKRHKRCFGPFLA